MTARNDLDYIGREELLEALKRVSAEFIISHLTKLTLFVIRFSFLTLFIYFSFTFQQKGTFETGQEDSTDIPEELRLRLAYREAAVAVLACYLPDPYRPIVEVAIIIHQQCHFVSCGFVMSICIFTR